MILLMLGVGWLVNNAVVNLSAVGKDFDFRFLWQSANYDINQTLIPYDNQDTHARAALVGILNTLLVAALGCLTATILGIVFGVLRLSKNWIVAKIALIYVEMFRNVPVLLWILLTMTIVNEIAPSPRALREVETGAVVVTNRGIYIPAPILEAGANIVIAVFLLSVAALFLVRSWARKRQMETGEQLPMFWIGLAILIVPTALVYFVLGMPISLEYPELKGFNFRGGINIRDSLIALWLALSVYTGAFIAEIVRAGILSVSRGQTEAAFALGLPPGRTMNLIILPQALRVIIPPLISQFLNLTKNSSLAIAIGYLDVTGTLGGITLNQTGREMECILLLMAVYLFISLVISAVMNFYNSRVRLVER
ncbi:amino acid ABC transporter permease [Acuticoccus sp. I52.16.1]|uniref:amino acid ABC transporter permease n=1 Tax=Acuticoccus sp. I52.16.1 TaxID=2928472 RepID=UPI001FD34CD1|nr:ABC transporter permease subunit [Acuticoccus sp. I52.16.1]UOM34732.1 ABC transporter permease subunit [Acuticoccus sp. I52.16.1]